MLVPKSRPASLILFLLVTALAGCDEPGLTYGDANSVIAVTDPERWAEISDSVYGAIERTIQTVRDEKAFTVTYQEPYAQYWENLRRFRQMLLIGTLSDPWMEEALDKASDDVDVDGPGLYDIGGVWSREQTVRLIVLPDDGSLGGLPSLLDEVSETLDQQFRQYARSRMYFSGVDQALADTLAAEAGFRVVVPDVYRWMTEDSVFIFRNDQPDPSELIRQVAVTWRSPASGELDPEEILQWRQSIANTYYTQEQEVDEDAATVQPHTLDGRQGLRLQAQWRNPPDLGWPAGGPLMTYTVTCDEQDRTYLIDAWLYAPGREKYEYIIQLETIVDSFSCTE